VRCLVIPHISANLALGGAVIRLSGACGCVCPWWPSPGRAERKRRKRRRPLGAALAPLGVRERWPQAAAARRIPAILAAGIRCAREAPSPSL